MKPFDLEKALAGEAVVTRDGRKVTELVKFSVDSKYRLFGNCRGVIYSWLDSGKATMAPVDADTDLFMGSTERTAWVNLYPRENPLSPSQGNFAVHYRTELAANEVCGDFRLGGKAHKITWED